MANKKDKYKSSFGIIRANPRISGNLKITIDSNDNIWLNSIDSNSEMSKNQYKGYRLSQDGTFPVDVYRFFNSGTTPTSYIFGIKGEDSVSTSYTQTLEDQYDGFYHTGVTPLISSIYTENFSYFSPFWMGEDIPGYFVIFRINDPIDFSYVIPVSSLIIGNTYKVLESFGLDTSSSTYLPYTISSNGIQYKSGDLFIATSTIFTEIQGIGNVTLFDPNYNISSIKDTQEHFVKNILPKSSIVATYSLGSDSKIGKYIRKIKDDPNYSSYLINMQFEDQTITTYNGVSIKDGAFCTKGEYLSKDYTRDSTIIEFEQLITNGFQRNDVISYNLLNFEFLFNDNDANLYTINRYYGLYVDSIPTGTFQLDGNAFFNKASSVGNLPSPRSPLQVSNAMTLPFYENNINGIRLFIDSNSVWGYIPSSDDIHITERLKMFYVKDKKNDFYSYKQILNYSEEATENDKWGKNTTQQNLIILSNKLLDLSKFSGIDNSKTKEYSASMTQTAGRSYSVIRIANQLLPGNCIVLYHPFGKNIEGNKRFDYFVASSLSNIIGGWGPGSFLNDSDVYYFHPFGTNQQIAQAIAGALNSIQYKSYEAFNINDEIIIRTNGSNSILNTTYSLFIYSDFYNKIQFITKGSIYFNEIEGKDLNTILNFIGGSKYTNTRIKLKTIDANNITPGVSYVRTNYGISPVKFVGKCIDYTDYEIEYNTIKDYSTYSIIEIEDNTQTVLLGTSKTVVIEELVNVETGIFSMYGIKDLDMNFWLSTYGITPTEEYYRYLDVQPNGITPIYGGIDYAVANGAIIEYNNIQYGGPNITGGYIFRGVTGISEYSLIQSSTTARSNVVPALYVNNIFNAISAGTNDPQVDLDKFPGFIGLQDIKFINDVAGISTKYDEMNFGKLVNEYDVLKENYITNFVTLSRVTPYITKWIYEGGIDVRGNDYRLNNSPAFTPLNFSPSFFSPGVSPLYFTNEWYLLETPPLSATPTLLQNSSNYCVDSVSLESLQNADPSLPDYFLNYFSIDGNDYYNLDNVRFSGLKSKKMDQRYTYLNFNPVSGFSETLFRGVKIRIKERTDSSLLTKQSNLFKTGDQKFNDYKFSCILKSIEDPNPYSVTSPITFNVHENDTFKHITFLITIVNNDSRFIDFEKLSEVLFNAAGPANSTSTDPIGSYYFNPTGIYGSSDYMGLYSISNKYKHSVYGGTSNSTDYAGINSGGILYSSIADVKLSSGLNIGTMATIGITPYVDVNSFNGSGIVPIAVNPSYDTDLRNEVKFYPVSTPVNSGPTGFRQPYTLYSPSSINTGDNLYSTPWPVGAGKNYLNFNEISYPDYYFDFTGLGYGPPVFTRIPVPIPYKKINNDSVYQVGAGNNYWDSILNAISFPEIYKLFLNNSSFINYTRSTWDSVNNKTVIDNGTFVLEFIQPASFIQTSVKIPIEDNSKPQAYANSVIGYQLIEKNAITEFFRYSGGYSPKFNDILLFDNLKNENLQVDINGSNPLDITLDLYLKTDTSDYYGIGSMYEIYVDGSPRKNIRLVTGNTYNFIFNNFSPNVCSSINKNFALSTIQFSGDPSNSYTTGFIYNSGMTGASFTVPQNAPNVLYYQIAGEDYGGGILTITENLNYKNITFGINKDFFGIVRDVNYYKYSLYNVSKIDPNSGYSLKYPLIGETPIDKRDMFIFESTWDPGRYLEYTSTTTYGYLPGTKNLLEQKSFFGSKVMQTPNLMKHPTQSQYTSSITNVFNINADLYPNYEILWEQTPTNLNVLLLVDRTVISHFRNGGIDQFFYNLLVPEFGVNNSSVLSDDTSTYIEENIIPEYEIKQLDVYINKIKITPSTAASNAVSALPLVVTNLSDFDKISNGYVKSTNNNITKVGSLKYQYTLKLDSAYNYSVAFSLLVGKI